MSTGCFYLRTKFLEWLLRALTTVRAFIPTSATTLPIEDSIDLHTFQPREVASVVEEYLEECRRAGFAEVRLIHGKGIGVQRDMVRSVLRKHPAVLSYRDAPAAAGGWGATVVILKPEN